MLTIDLPIFTEYLYPTEKGEDGYKKTGRQGVLGNMTCKQCGKIHGKDLMLIEDPNDICYPDLEIDCECTETFVSFDHYDLFEVEVLNKNHFQDSFDFGEPALNKSTGMFTYVAHVNTSTIPDVWGGPSTQVRGVLGEITCEHCLKKYNAYILGAQQIDVGGQDIIVCTNCNRTYIKIQRPVPEPTKDHSEKSSGNLVLSKPKEVKEDFIEGFFEKDTEDEDSLLDFFK